MDRPGEVNAARQAQLEAGLTCAEKQLLELYQSIDFGRNEICQSCRKECPTLSRPISAWVVGKNYYSHDTRLLFVGKTARGEPGEQYHDFQFGFSASRDWLWQKRWPYWSYTRTIAENIYCADSIENIAFTNIVKCNDSMGKDTTPSFAKKCCICELNIIGREIDIIDPTHIIFYTSQGYDDYIRHIFDNFEIEINTEIAIGQKKMPWLEAIGTLHGKHIKILRVGHPERKRKANYVSAICEWVSQAK